MSTRPVVAATDGSELSLPAVRWAAAEARRRGAPLEVVHAYDREWLEVHLDDGSRYLDAAEELAAAAATTGADEARRTEPGVPVSTRTLLGRPVPALVAATEEAGLLVLGSRGHGGFAGLLLGSVSQRVATQARCPVVVVRGAADPQGPVVAGVDDSAAAEAVLSTAFDAAAARDCPLIVVRSCTTPVPQWLAGAIFVSERSRPAWAAAERDRLDRLVTPWQAKYPGVRVEPLITHDSAAAVLAGLSRGAQLIVCGAHGRGVVPAALLGSTTLQLLHHAGCPVEVTHAHRSTP
ncbi:universal stress protein [Actinoplanes sp. N902-109]|uniref:universal stress protein n=1 Tax=Actinoplanes sp. (strain N902-109) TaxID=649831 RepID=UPI0003295373|nr:universal stress protein [Actinoplanes sp. N902-109]AGL16921.1 UspA domain-containing protein [Actinoplanes sp. N902-109]